MEAVALAGLAAWCFAIALGGGLVGLVLGNLRLPLMVTFASSAAAGAGANIAVIGLLGGIVGLILGSLRMPALLRWVGSEPRQAVGTNLVVGVTVGVAGLLGHLPGEHPDLRLFAIGAAAPVPGARLTGRLNRRQLLRVRAVGVMLLVAAAGMVLSAAT